MLFCCTRTAGSTEQPRLHGVLGLQDRMMQQISSYKQLQPQLEILQPQYPSRQLLPVRHVSTESLKVGHSLYCQSCMGQGVHVLYLCEAALPQAVVISPKYA